jgi:malonate transporter
MQAIVDVAFPVFAIMACGWIAGRIGLLGDLASEALNRFVYFVALPPLMFGATAKVPLAEILHWPYLAAYGGGALVTFLFAFVVARKVFPDRFACLSLHGLSAIYSNTGYMGIPLLLSAFGQAGAPPAIVASIINASIVLGIATVLIELDLGHDSGKRPSQIARDVILATIKNPLVIAPLAGVAVSLLGLQMPKALDTFCTLIGASASPCALFAIGLFLVGKPIAGDLKEVGWLCVLKLVLQPLLTYWIAFKLLSMDPVWAKSAVIMAALPIGTTLSVLGQKYGIYVRRATAAVLISTVLSVLTVSALLVFLEVG